MATPPSNDYQSFTSITEFNELAMLTAPLEAKRQTDLKELTTKLSTASFKGLGSLKISKEKQVEYDKGKEKINAEFNSRHATVCSTFYRNLTTASNTPNSSGNPSPELA